MQFLLWELYFLPAIETRRLAEAGAWPRCTRFNYSNVIRYHALSSVHPDKPPPSPSRDPSGDCHCAQFHPRTVLPLCFQNCETGN